MRDGAQRSLREALRVALGSEFYIQGARTLRSGSMHHALRCETNRGPLFVKVAPLAAFDTFAAEAAGLAELGRPNAVRTPRVWALGRSVEGAFIALEWLDLRSESRASAALLGEQLAVQHRFTQAQFGWTRDNSIGATPQINTRCDDWVSFFREHRLRRQLELAYRNGAERALREPGERLCAALHVFFSSYQPSPSLLHGDLWGGNWGTDAEGLPVIFDPAVYYGDREADIAMTRLFGGFGTGFYTAYQSTWPLAAGAEVRATLYNLYHVLNHYNVFGGVYLAQAQTMIAQLLAQC